MAWILKILFPISPSTSEYSIPPPLPTSFTPGSLSWDFFNVFTALENPYHLPVDTRTSQPFDGDSVDLKHVRDEEGIPDLEDGDEGKEGIFDLEDGDHGEEYIHDEIREVNHLEEST